MVLIVTGAPNIRYVAKGAQLQSGTKVNKTQQSLRPVRAKKPVGGSVATPVKAG